MKTPREQTHVKSQATLCADKAKRWWGWLAGWGSWLEMLLLLLQCCLRSAIYYFSPSTGGEKEERLIRLGWSLRRRRERRMTQNCGHLPKNDAQTVVFVRSFFLGYSCLLFYCLRWEPWETNWSIKRPSFIILSTDFGYAAEGPLCILKVKPTRNIFRFSSSHNKNIFMVCQPLSVLF